jgi:hypothetical protein
VGDELRRDPEGRLSVRQPDLDILVADTVTQDVHRAPFVELLRQTLCEALPGNLLLTAVCLDKLAPCLSLGQLDEGEQLSQVQPERGIEIVAPLNVVPDLACEVGASGREMAADLVLEELLPDRGHAATGTSTCPVTAAVIKACRRSFNSAIWSPSRRDI